MHDGTPLAKFLADHVFVNIKAQIPDKEGVALRARLISKVLSASVGTTTGIGIIRSGSREIHIDLAAINLGSFLHLQSIGSIRSVGKLNIAKAIIVSMCACTVIEDKTYPFERPVALSDMTLHPTISPNSSNSLASHSSSTFQLKLPTKRFFGPSSETAVPFSALAFFATGSVALAALRFLDVVSSSSLLPSSLVSPPSVSSLSSLSESPSDSESSDVSFET
jgi:hypothetical protein